jgi:hypothetical protein
MLNENPEARWGHPRRAPDRGDYSLRRTVAAHGQGPSPEVNPVDASALTGYNMATTMVEVLGRCGYELTRADVMKQAAGQRRSTRFEGERRQPFRGLLNIELGR